MFSFLGNVVYVWPAQESNRTMYIQMFRTFSCRMRKEGQRSITGSPSTGSSPPPMFSHRTMFTLGRTLCQLFIYPLCGETLSFRGENVPRKSKPFPDPFLSSCLLHPPLITMFITVTYRSWRVQTYHTHNSYTTCTLLFFSLKSLLFPPYFTLIPLLFRRLPVFS